MNKEYLEEIQETIIRRIKMSEVMGGLTSSDKKLIDLWNYTIELQDKINQLETNRDEAIEVAKNNHGNCMYCEAIEEILERGKE